MTDCKKKSEACRLVATGMKIGPVLVTQYMSSMKVELIQLKTVLSRLASSGPMYKHITCVNVKILPKVTSI